MIPYDNLALRSMADVFLKEAMDQVQAPQQQPGKMEKYMPWYGAAAGGAGMHMLAKKLVPKKYQMAGAIGGAVLGTAMGVHGGEALGKRLDRPKVAVAPAEGFYDTFKGRPNLTDAQWTKKLEAEGYPHREKKAAKEEMPPHPGVTLGKSMLGFGLGTAAGYVGMKGLDALMRARGGAGLPRNAAMAALPIVTGLGGLAYTHMQNKTLGKMRQDHLQRQENKRERKES